jgi:hypothetical protein
VIVGFSPASHDVIGIEWRGRNDAGIPLSSSAGGFGLSSAGVIVPGAFDNAFEHITDTGDTDERGEESVSAVPVYVAGYGNRFDKAEGNIMLFNRDTAGTAVAASYSHTLIGPQSGLDTLYYLEGSFLFESAGGYDGILFFGFDDSLTVRVWGHPTT